MSYLVDTQYLLWSLIDPSRIGARIRRLLADPGTTKHASTVSFWEIALKYSIGKLKLEGSTPEGVLRATREAGYEILDLDADDVATSYRLPPGENHKDPFDRLIVWQCLRNDLTLLSADGRMREYVRHGLRLVS